MAINPFDIVLAQATEREAQKAAEREAAAKLRKEQARAAAEANRVKELSERRLKFGHRFLEVVATKVVRPEWGPNVILDIKQYAEALLGTSDKPLPTLSPYRAEKILDRLEYGLSLPYNEGLFPEGFLFGQRLLAEREAEKAEAEAAKAARPKPLRFTPPPTVEQVMERPVEPPINQADAATDLPPAVMLPKRRRDKVKKAMAS